MYFALVYMKQKMIMKFLSEGSLGDAEGRGADIRHGLGRGGHFQAEEEGDRGGRQHRGKEVSQSGESNRSIS